MNPSSANMQSMRYQSVTRIEKRLSHEHLSALLQGAVVKKANVSGILEKAGIQPHVAVNGVHLQALIMAIRNELDDHYLGFLQVPGKLAMDARVGAEALACSTLGEGIRHLADFINAVRSDEVRSNSVDPQTGEFALAYKFTGFMPGVDPHVLYWYRLFWGYRFYCWLIGERIRLSRVCFSAPYHNALLDYSQMFNCDVYFGCKQDQICFDSDYLKLPIVRSESEIARQDFPKNYANWFTIPGSDHSISSQVERIIVELCSKGLGSPTIEVVSNVLGLSRRTLSRKLSKENESFQKIKSRIRCDQAIKYLLDSDIPVTHVAEKVGFAEPGDFSRAFLNWTGLSPSSYRNAGRKAT